MLPAAQPTCFLIADISGYKGYLADVELDHAQDILADLIGAVITALRPRRPVRSLESRFELNSGSSSVIGLGRCRRVGGPTCPADETASPGSYP